MKEITLFLSNREIQSIKNFYEDLDVDISNMFDFNGSTYCGRTYVDVTPAHETISLEEDGIRIKGLGRFYVDDEE